MKNISSGPHFSSFNISSGIASSLDEKRSALNKQKKFSNNQQTNTTGLESQDRNNGSTDITNKNFVHERAGTSLPDTPPYAAKSSQPKGEIASITKSSDIRSSDKDIDEAKWYVKHYTNKLIDAKTSDEQVMYHKLLKQSQATLDSLGLSTYSSYSSNVSSLSTPSASKHEGDKDINEAKWYVDHYTKELGNAITSKDQVTFHKLLKNSQAKLDSLQSKKYSSSIINSSSHTSTSSKQSVNAEKSEIDKTKEDVDYYKQKYFKASNKEDEDYYADKVIESQSKLEALEGGKSSSYAPWNTASHPSSQTSSSAAIKPSHASHSSEIEKLKSAVDHFTDEYMKSKKGSYEEKYYLTQYSTAKVKYDNFKKSEGTAAYGQYGKTSATHAHSSQTSSSKPLKSELDDAKDDVQYYKDKCNTTSKYSPNYTYYYDKYTQSKQKLSDLENVKTSQTKVASSSTTQPSAQTPAQDSQSDLEKAKDDVAHYKNKFTHSKYGSSDYEYYLDKYAKAQTALNQLESKKPSSTSIYGSESNSSSHASGKTSESEIKKLQDDIDYYKEKFIDSYKGSSDYDYYIKKYSEASSKLDKLTIGKTSSAPSKTEASKSEYSNTTNPSHSSSNKGSKSEIDKTQEDVEYYKDKFMESESGTSDSDYYLKKYSEATVKLDNLNKSKISPSGSSHVSGVVSTPASKASQTDIDTLKANIDYYKDKWYAAAKGSSDDDYYWEKYSESKNKLEKLENPQTTVSANTLNAKTPSDQAPVPKAKNITKAQEQIDVLMQKANDANINPSERKTILDKVKGLNEQAQYEHKLESMETDTGDLTPPTGHNHLKADYVISSHGSYKPADGWVDLPPGIFIRTNAKHGSPINNGLGWALEEDRASNYRFSELWTNKIRNYKITKELSFENNKNATIIQVPIPKDEQHILDIVAPYVPTHFDPEKDKPILFDAAFCLADKLTDNYEYTFGADGPYKK